MEFYRLEKALEFAKLKDEFFVFSKDVINKKSGKMVKRFYVYLIHEFYEQLLKIPSEKRVFYELYTNWNPMKIFFDIDFYPEKNLHLNDFDKKLEFFLFNFLEKELKKLAQWFIKK